MADRSISSNCLDWRLARVVRSGTRYSFQIHPVVPAALCWRRRATSCMASAAGADTLFLNMRSMLLMLPMAYKLGIG